MSEERRCGNCGALVSADAEWCGQCFASLREPEPPPPPPPPATGRSQPPPASSGASSATPEAPTEAPFWPCSVCGAHNAIFLEVCETCGTPFSKVMRGTTRRDVDPQAAFQRSLVFPGAGHAMLGYGIDGFARAVLFTLSIGITLFLSINGLRTGPMLLAIVVSLALAVGIYVLSALEVRQLAAGGRLIVESKYLLWGSVGVMFLVVGMIGLSVATSARR